MITAAPFFCFVFPNTKIPGRTTWNLCVEMYITTKGIEKSKKRRRQNWFTVLSPLITGFRFSMIRSTFASDGLYYSVFFPDVNGIGTLP